jgi:hypothetical protein
VSKLKIDLRLSDDKTTFRPLDPYSREKTHALKAGGDYTVTVASKRDLDQNRAYRAGLAWAVENIEQIGEKYPTSEHLHKALLIQLGYYSEVPFITLRDEPVTDRMIAAGLAELLRLKFITPNTAPAVAEILPALYNAMRREGPHYGLNIVPDSTSFDAMDADTFTLFFDRAKILVMQWCGRDPWEESGEADKDRKRAASLASQRGRWE